MPSSVRSRTPRLDNVRKNSSTSIHIDREVTMVTSAADGSNKKAVYSTADNGREGHAGSGHARAQSSHGPTGVESPTPVMNRWNSMSKLSPASRVSHQDASASPELTSNKESMRALAEFLMRSEPPPSNYMSKPESDGGSLHSIKRSAFKIFGRQKSKKATRPPRLLQLPDSAVAATTTNGARHIAISIPLEYDYPYHATPARHSTPPSRPLSQPRAPGERGAVTVLKPVVEVRESISSYLTKNKSNEEVDRERNRTSQAGSIETPAADVLGLGATQTMEKYYTQLHRQQRNMAKSSNAEGKQAVKPDPASTHKSYLAVSSDAMGRQESTRSVTRHSHGTAYSTASIATYVPSHSRGQSSTSSAQSPALISSLRPELPPRKSSVSKVPRAIQIELANTYAANKTLAAEDARASVVSEGSVFSVDESTSSGTVIATAETAKNYNAAAGIQTISRTNTPSRSNTPKGADSLQPTSPAPTRQLPDVPESPCVPSFYPSPSLPTSRNNSPKIGVVDETQRKSTPPTKDRSEGLRQNRHDRVKAKKQRDLAVHKDKSTHEISPLTETVSSTNPQILVSTPPRSAKRRSTHPESTHKRGYNVISEVILVANLAPYTGEVKLEDPPHVPTPERAAKKRVKDSDSNGNMSARGTHTPPSSAGSETDMTSSRVRSRASARSPALDARRQERRLKRNMSLREKETDARLGKLERDHTMLINTLSGIANSFGELSRVLPQSGLRLRSSGMLTDVDREMKDGGDGGSMQAGGKA